MYYILISRSLVLFLFSFLLYWWNRFGVKETGQASHWLNNYYQFGRDFFLPSCESCICSLGITLVVERTSWVSTTREKKKKHKINQINQRSHGRSENPTQAIATSKKKGKFAFNYECVSVWGSALPQLCNPVPRVRLVRITSWHLPEHLYQRTEVA